MALSGAERFKSTRPSAAAAAATVMAGLALLVACWHSLGGSDRSGLLEGGGFLGDLPKGGETGKQTVRDMKALLKDTADKTQLQNKLASKLLGKAAQNVHSAKARAAAAAAAAEIAKILDVPSARDIVEGRSRQQQPPSHAKAKHTQTLKIATWLKTPKDEGKFTYSNKRLKETSSPCATRHDYECNEMDTASQAHGWADTPDRSVMGASNYDAQY